MKGLHGGIPLAVLAATAHAQAQAIGGSHGTDIGNHASVPTKNTASNSVTEDITDDHSFELEHEIHVYPHGKDHHHHHHERSANAPEGTLIDGPGGVDVGNSASFATVNEFSSSFEGKYKDDHSVKIDKTTIIKGQKDHHHHRRNDDKFPEVPEVPTAIGGAHGVDIGNIADIPTINDFDSDVSESYDDDHSIDVDKNTFIEGGHERRGRSSVIDGPGGVDVGSSAFIPTVNEFSSSFTGKYKDDHSVDIDKTTIIKKPDHRDEHPALGFHHPMHHARNEGPDTVIGGAHGVDIGNEADIPTLNSFTSSVDEEVEDSHSVDVDKTTIIKPWGHDDWKRAQRQGGEDTTLIDGPHGADIGNVYASPTVNKFDTATEENVKDNHAVKINEFEVVKPGEPHWEGDHGHGEPHYEGHGEPHDEGHGEPHDEEHGEPHYEGHGEEEQHAEPAFHGYPAPPAAEKPEDPECTTVHEVVHTVTSTRTQYQTQTAVVYPHESHSGHNSPSGETSYGDNETPKGSEQPENSNWDKNNWQKPGGSSKDNGETPKGSGQAENSNSDKNDSQKPSGSNNDNSSWNSGSNESPSESSNNNTPSGQDNSQWESNPSSEPTSAYPSSNPNSDTDSDEAYGSFATPAAETTPYSHGWQVAQTPAAAGATPTGAANSHAPTTSAAVAHQQASSTFAVIPVQVPSPSGTPRAHGSVGIGASSSFPVSSSALRAMHMPTGASAEQNERPGAGEMFTGGGARGVSPAAGAFSVLAAVFALLAFAM